MGDESVTPREPRRIALAEDRWANVRHIAETIAIVAAGLWAFYVFVYQEEIKPAGEPAALEVSISIQRLGRDARHDMLLVSTNYRNAGKTEIDVAADGFDVWGIRYASSPRSRRLAGAATAGIANDIPERSRSLIEASVELREAAIGGDVKRHIILEPNSAVTLAQPIVLAPGAYDALEAYVFAVPVKTSANEKVNVTIDHDKDRGLFLRGHVSQDDNKTDFALIPYR